MLRRVNAALFEAPVGARIAIVAESQNNHGVNDARFEYAGRILAREMIQGLPGCSFTVEDATAQLQAVVAFADTAPDIARYDLAEVENGVKSLLGKFAMKSDGAPFISFAIDPMLVAARTPVRAARRTARKKPGRKKERERKSTSRGSSRKHR